MTRFSFHDRINPQHTQHAASFLKMLVIVKPAGFLRPPCSFERRFYGEPIPGHVLCDRVASYVHMFNLYWAFR